MTGTGERVSPAIGGGMDETTFDAAVAQAIEQGRTPSGYRIPGTEPNLSEVRRLKAGAYRQVKIFRERVKALGPRAGQSQLELLKAESQWKELTLLEKQALRDGAKPAAPVRPVIPYSSRRFA